MIRPLRDRIVVRPDPLAAHATATAIVLQARTGITTSQEQFGRTGTVLSVGPGKASRKTGQRAPLDLAPGDRVLFGEWLYPQADGLLVMQEADIAGVVTA